MPRKAQRGEPDDRTRYLHMLEAAREAMGFVAGKTIEDLQSSRLLLRALMSCVQEIGEAASKISPAARMRLPELPWKDVVGVRQIMVHVYWGVRADRLWHTVTVDLPDLVSKIEKVLAEWDARA
ncbi:MAG TPA: HepT-like ribonuclease domain-containing protein [Phycisphaerales bacterium]|nr:HepT-like ribonuclease domain-containing protein [Phycisphaerales bacterium]